MYSIIVPVFNEAALIESQLQTLQDLRDTGHEVIVVDGGSSDTTPKLAAPYADKLIQSDKGRARQMNAGAAAASGTLLFFLHIDTLLPANLPDLFRNWQDNNDWGFFRARLSGRHVLLRLIEWFMNQRSRLTGIATGDQVLTVSRDLFVKAGGFPDIALMEDIAICKQLKKFKKPVCLDATVLSSSRRWEQKGIIKTILQMWLLRLLYFSGVSPDALVKLYYRDAK